MNEMAERQNQSIRKMLAGLLLFVAILAPSVVLAGVAGHYVRYNSAGVANGEADLVVSRGGTAFLQVKAYDLDKTESREGRQKQVSNIRAAGMCNSDGQKNYLQIAALHYQRKGGDGNGSWQYRKPGLTYTFVLAPQRLELQRTGAARQAVMDLGGVYRQVRETPDRHEIFGEMLLEYLPAARLGLDPKGTEELVARAVKMRGGKMEGIDGDFTGYRVDVYGEEGRKAKRDFYFLVTEGLDRAYRVKDGKATLLYMEQ